MTPRPALALAVALGACVPITAPAPDATVSAKSGPSTLHSFTIDRAYTLTDPRELAFRDQIVTVAQQRCGFGGFGLYSSRPIGAEVVGEDFLYRQHEVQITCEGGE